MTKKTIFEAAHKLFITICIASLCLFFINWLAQCVSLLRYPYLTEYRDWGGIELTNQLFSRAKPYSLTDGVPFFYIYGFSFPLLVGLINIPLNVDVLLLTKILVFMCVIGAALVVAYEVFSLTRSGMFSALGFSIMLWASWNQGVFFILRPDSLAILLVSITLMVVRRSQRSMPIIFSAATVVVLFYTKSYFAFVLPSIILFLYFGQRRKSLLLFVSSFSIIFTLALGVVQITYPGYFYAAILAQAGAVGGGWSWALKQTEEFSKSYWPLFLGILLYIIQIIPDNKIHYSVKGVLSKFSSSDSAPSSEIIYLYSLIFGCLCLLPLSTNTGAYLNYHYQLIIPSITIVGLVATARLKNKIIQKFYIVLIIFFCVFHGSFNNQTSTYSATDVKNWELIATSLSRYHDNKILIASPIIAPLANKNSLILDNGHSEYYIGLIPDKNKPSQLFPLFQEHQEYFKSFIDYYLKIHQKIKQQEFGLIVVTKEYHPLIPQQLLDEKYRKDDGATLKTGGQDWQIEFWTPKK